MLIPKGVLVHKELDTSYVKINELINHLKSQKFSGYLQLLIDDIEGFIFFKDGTIIHGLVNKGKEKMTTGEDAINFIQKKGTSPGGTISTNKLSPSKIDIILNSVEGEPVYKNLYSEFTSLNNLIKKLRNEKHNGHIEIMEPKEEELGSIYFKDGNVVESLFSTKNGELLSGRDALRQISEVSKKPGILFNVYKGEYRSVSKEGIEKPEKIDYEDLNGMLKVLGAIIGGVEKVIDQTYGENTFVKAFRSVLIDISEDFPFLDPFAAEFEYKDGEIEFVGNEDRDGFTKGIQEALLLTISNVSEGKDSEKLIAKVREELKSVLEKFPNEITGFKIDEKMKNIIEL